MSRRTAERTSGDYRLRLILRLIAGLLCSVGMLAASPLPTAWRHWKYSRPVELPPAEATRLVSIRVPQNLYAHAAPFLADVRVIDDRGAEVPFVLTAEQNRAQYAPPYAASILENSFSPNHYTQVVLYLKKYDGFHRSARIDTSESEFMEWVEVAASDDARVWRIVQERAPIFRFAREGHGGTNVVSYSPNNARYLRLRILDAEKKFSVIGAQILAASGEKPQREPLGVAFAPEKPPAPNESAWSADLGTGDLPLREVRFQAGPGDFVREVTVESSRDGNQWSWIGSGEIYRFAQGGRPCEQLSVLIGGTPGRYLRVEIVNGNDRPLQGAVPALYIAAERLAFEQNPGRSYWLLYGESEAKPPQYDLSRRVSAQQIDGALTVRAGPEEVNSDWADPRPWTETHKFVLWLGVALAVLLIAYTALQSLRRTTISPSQNDSRRA